jgi:hypothetical protein
MKDFLEFLPVGGLLGASFSGYIYKVKLAFVNALSVLEIAEKFSGLILTWSQIIAAGLAAYVAYKKLKNK